MSRLDARNKLQNLAARVQAAGQAIQIYPPSHPQLEQALEECFAELGKLLGGDPKIQIAVADRVFVLGNVQVQAEGEVLAEFATALESLGIQKLIFIEGIRRWELQRFLSILAMDIEEVAREGGVEELLEKAGVDNIEAGTVTIDVSQLVDPDVLFRTWEAYSTGLKAVRAVRMRAREAGEVGDAGDIRDFAYRLTELSMQETRPFLAVHALMQHDEYTFTHSTNVAMLTLAMAQNLPFSHDDLHEIAVASLLHDIGKEQIPQEIIQKKGSLTDEEWAIVNRHGLIGAQMLAHAEGVGDLAPIVAFEHHLAYHEELREAVTWEPHLVSQLVALADVYDALRSSRSYRDGLPPDECMKIMKEDAGTKFDPVLFEGFYRMVGPYPPGTTVSLSSGAIAVVFANNPEDPDNPQVVVVRNAHGEDCDEPVPVNLTSADVNDAVDEVIDATSAGIDAANYL